MRECTAIISREEPVEPPIRLDIDLDTLITVLKQFKSDDISPYRKEIFRHAIERLEELNQKTRIESIPRCAVSSLSLRVCELGTRGCVVEHD